VSTKSTTQPTSRQARRAAERRDRFATARDQRRNRVAASSQPAGWLSTRNLTLGALGIGVLLIALLAVNQLGGSSPTATVKDPGIDYPAAIQDGTALGSTTAPVVMEVWGDFQCPVCGQHSLRVEPSLVNGYVFPGKLRIVHHDIDILGRGGDESRLPAIGGVCANEQGRYWAYNHWVFENQQGENQGAFKRDRVIQIAAAAGLDRSAFTACLDGQAATDAFAATQAQGQQLEINQTPTMFLNGTRYAGLKTPEAWAALIDAELARASASPAPSGPAASPQAVASSAP
jgi:protein-disulfide isomerase